MAFSLFSILPAVTAGGAILTNIQVTLTGVPSASATVGVPYSFTPVAGSGSGTKTFSLTGLLLGGLTFDTTTGSITGTPTTAGTMAGLNITVSDLSGSATLGSFSIIVATAGVLQPATLATSVKHKGATYYFNQPALVGRYAQTDLNPENVEPFVVSDRNFQIVQITPDAFVAASTPFKWTNPDKTVNPSRTSAIITPDCVGNGAQINPWNTTGQAWDGLIQYRDENYAGSTDTMLAYSDADQVDPALKGPIAITAGDAKSVVKAIRYPGVTSPAGIPAQSINTLTEQHCVLHVVPTAPPLNAFAPPAVGFDKASYFTADARNKSCLGDGFTPYVDASSIYNQRTLEQSDAGKDFYTSLYPFFGEGVGISKRWINGYANGVQVGGYSTKYGSGFVPFYLALLAKGKDACPDWAYNRVLQFAIHWLGWIERGVYGGAGSGQWCALAFPLRLLSHSFPTMPGLWEKVLAFQANATNQHYYVPQTLIGSNVAFPDGRPVNHGTYQDAQLLQPHFSAEVHVNPPIPNPTLDGLLDSTYEFVAGPINFPEQLAIALLVNGPNGLNGMYSSSGGTTIDPSNPQSAHMAYFDQYPTFRTYDPVTTVSSPEIYKGTPTISTWLGMYYMLRGRVPVPRYQALPNAPNVEQNLSAYLAAGTGTGTGLGAAPVGTFAYDLRGLNHSYPAATGADVEYSFDRISWVPIAGTSLTGQSPVLAPGLYSVRIRLINALGKGPWTVNYKRIPYGTVADATDRWIVTVGGTASGAVAQVQAPAIHVQKYYTSSEPIYTAVTGAIDISKYQILYAGRGMQTGLGTGGVEAPTAYRWYRNTTATLIDSVPNHTITNADTGQNLFFQVDIAGVTYTSNTVSVPALSARPAGVIIDQVLDYTFPINYPNVYQSGIANIPLATVSGVTAPRAIDFRVEPQWVGFTPPDEDGIQTVLVTGRLVATKNGQYPSYILRLSADVPLINGKTYSISGFSFVVGEYKVEGSRYYNENSSLSRPIIYLGSSLNGTQYYSSEALVPKPDVLGQPKIWNPAIPNFTVPATGSTDLWMTIQANQIAGQSAGADPMITGKITVKQIN